MGHSYCALTKVHTSMKTRSCELTAVVSPRPLLRLIVLSLLGTAESHLSSACHAGPYTAYPGSSNTQVEIFYDKAFMVAKKIGCLKKCLIPKLKQNIFYRLIAFFMKLYTLYNFKDGMCASICAYIKLNNCIIGPRVPKFCVTLRVIIFYMLLI